MARLICPIKGCEKEYVKDTYCEAVRSMRAHLTGKHCLKGADYKKAMIVVWAYAWARTH